jgi:excisionase family DNA binding protein
MNGSPGYLHGVNAEAQATESTTWWSIDDVCAYLQLTAGQVGRLVRKHGLPYRDFGGVRRYPRERVQVWAESGITESAPAPRKRRADAGRPAAVRRTERARVKGARVTYLGVAPMPG